MTPINTFAGSPLDRAGDLRQDPAWLAEQEANRQARALVLWEGRPLLGDDGALAWLALAHARDIAPDRDLFLGLDGEAPVFAVEIEGSADPAQGPLKGMGGFSDLRGAAAVLPGGEAAMAGAAKSLFDWRRRHGFCAACGTESRTAAGGWKRKCPACGTEHFPRVDPVVIMLPVFNGGPEPLCLLGRQASWPQGRMSALAGFLEPGESIEEACAREVAEEAGLRVTGARYHSSQPWPFPYQLMIGLIAEVDSEDARPDQTELESVRWFTREEARQLIAGGYDGCFAPPAMAIAHQLIKSWSEE